MLPLPMCAILKECANQLELTTVLAVSTSEDLQSFG
jgi:hypothetical protein